MNTGSPDEKIMLANIARSARALERIADALEQHIYGVAGSEIAAIKRQLIEDMAASDRADLKAAKDVPPGGDVLNEITRQQRRRS